MAESEEVEGMWDDHRGDEAIISQGWSIKVSELKKALAEIPDDYEVMLEMAEVDDCEISNVNINSLYPPALGSPGLVVLGGGQIVTSEYAYHQRLDAHHAIGGDKRWHEDKGWYAL